MSYVIYNKVTGKELRAKGYTGNPKTVAAAKATLTRLDNKGLLDADKADFKIADNNTYREDFPVKMVKRVNLMSGEEFYEAEDTPHYCSPAYESFWSM